MLFVFSTKLDQTTRPHVHDVHELVIGTSGRGVLCSEAKSYAINSRQTVLVRPGVSHNYGLEADGTPVDVTYVCFDRNSVERYIAPSCRGELEGLLDDSVSVASMDEMAAVETRRLADMLKSARRDNGRFFQEKATSILVTILLNHLSANRSAVETGLTAKSEAIRKTRQWIDSNLGEDINIDKAAEMSHMSRSVFTRCFRDHTKMSFAHYLASSRARLAADLLGQQNLTITEVAYSSGYRNLGHFYKQFQKHFSKTPNQYRKVSLEMTFPAGQ